MYNIKVEYILGTIIFLFGAALGSFIAVIVNRYNTGLPFFRGRSFCFSCNTKLANKDLVPIFSFLSLKGKCRYCDSKIPKETLIIELIMGVLSLLAAFKSGFLIFNLSFFSFFHFLIILFIFANILLIAAYDLKHFIIPDSFLISLFILSFIYLLISNLSFFPSLLSATILAMPFLLIFLISKGTWFGFGDVKYILVLGFFLGFIQGLSAIVLAFWIGAVFSLLALSLKRLKPHINLPLLHNNFTIKSEIPFGPFLSMGVIISFYLNADLFQIHSLLGFL
jgi:prepilin signal peptidase PulO-like enzyme (type II secretory pathway)